MKSFFQRTPGFIIKIYFINNHYLGSPNNNKNFYSSSNSHLQHALRVIFMGHFQQSFHHKAVNILNQNNMVFYSLLNRGIWFPLKPFHDMNTAKLRLGLQLQTVMSHQQIAHSYLIWCPYVSPWYIKWKCLLPLFWYLFLIVGQEYLVWKKQVLKLSGSRIYLNCTTTSFFYFSHFANYFINFCSSY